MIIAKVVLTGGPCAGKTTALDVIRKEFTARGYRVLTVSEIATMMILGGMEDINELAENDREDYMVLETAIFMLQRSMGTVYDYLGRMIPSMNILVYDRAEMDTAAYTKFAEFARLLDWTNTTEDAIYADYDLVLHLTTAAEGAEAAYSLSNPARREKVLEDARKADKKVMEAWIGHPNHVIVDNTTDFAEKMHRVIEEIEKVIPRHE